MRLSTVRKITEYEIACSKLMDAGYKIDLNRCNRNGVDVIIPGIVAYNEETGVLYSFKNERALVKLLPKLCL